MSALAEVLQDPEVQKQYLALPETTRIAFNWRAKWLMAAHDHQIVPSGDWWTIWLMLAGRGAGKTRTAAEQIASWAWENPNTRWLVAAPTSADVRSTCFEGDSGLVSVIPQALIKDYNKTTHELLLVNGSLIKGIPASEPERFRGPQFHGAWFDELAAWDYLQEAWDMAMFGIRLGKKTQIICTTTPKPRDLIIELVGREGDDVVITRASTHANLANLAPSFQKQILQYEGTRLGRQEIYAELIDAEESGIVKRDMFRLWPANKPFPKFEYIIQSYDCAYTEKTYNDPTASTTWGMFKPLDGPMAVMLIDAWQDHLQYPDLRPKVIEEFKVSFGADPEAEGRGNFTSGKKVDLVLIEDKAAGISLVQDLRRAHLPVMPYNPGRADKIQRLSIVANIISTRRVWIPESSQRKGYVRDWAEGFVSQICSFPDATHDDYVDSCLLGETLIQMADGTSKRIDEVVVDDRVATPDGSQRVTKTFNNGMKEIWELRAGDATLRGTNNHNVMTDNGWIHIDRLITNVDNVYIYPQEESWHSKAKKALLLSQLYSMATNTIVTLKAKAQHIASTLQDQALDCIGMFGSTTMGQYPKASTSTILMATQATMTSPTLLALREKSIGLNTQRRLALETKLRSISRTLIELEARHQIGTSQMREGLGIKSIQVNLLPKLGLCLKSIQKYLTYVNGAAKKVLRRPQGRLFAVHHAKQQNQSTAVVSAVINTHTMQPVYDLTVENEHCYYANGILVHNCTQALRYLRDAGWLDIDPERQYDDDDYADSKPKRVNPYAI